MIFEHSLEDVNALYRLIKSRRSIRQFSGKAVPRDTVVRMLDAAIWAPSAHNRQPWRFVVIEKAHTKKSLSDAMASRLTSDLRADGVDESAIQRDVARSRERLTGAGVLILVCLSMVDMDTYPDEKRQSNERVMAEQSVAMASQNLLLAAHAEGLGAVWMCAPLFAPEEVVQALDLPESYKPRGIVAMGYPAESRNKTRKPLETRVIFK